MGKQYYTLIGSLPPMPKHFRDAERVPISARRLAQRLTMLETEDQQVVRALTNFLVWERQPLERTDEEVLANYDRSAETLRNDFALSLVRRAIDVRTVFAALRCRRLDLDPPPGRTIVARQIVQNWTHPDFRLGGKYPWILKVDQTLRGDSPFDVEEMRLDIAWQRSKRLSDQYFSSFEAVLLYLAKWELVYRWTQRDAELGRVKFEQLAREAMGKYANMYVDETS